MLLGVRRLSPPLLFAIAILRLHCIALLLCCLQGTVLPTVGSDLDAMEAPEKASKKLRVFERNSS